MNSDLYVILGSICFVAFLACLLFYIFFDTNVLQRTIIGSIVVIAISIAGYCCMKLDKKREEKQ